MNQTYFTVIVLIIAWLVPVTQSHAETAAQFTFSNYVKSERKRACAESPIPSCYEDFDKLAPIAERLDAQEKIAETFEESGKKDEALEVRRQTVADAVMLDLLLDSLIVLHKKRCRVSRC
jgi:hypothetical protein